MVAAFVAVLVTLAVLTGAAPALACPDGYQPCGTQYCCPR